MEQHTVSSSKMPTEGNVFIAQATGHSVLLFCHNGQQINNVKSREKCVRVKILAPILLLVDFCFDRFQNLFDKFDQKKVLKQKKNFKKNLK